MATLGSLLASYTRNWWVFLIQGILAVLFGILTFVYPLSSLLTLVMLYGAFVLADGIFALWGAFSAKSWWLGLYGVLGILVGIYALAQPGAAALALLMFVAIVAIVRGVMEIVTAIQLRKEVQGEWALILAGVLSVLFGVLILARPGAGALSVAWIIGTYAVFLGILYIILSFRVRSANKVLESVGNP